MTVELVRTDDIGDIIWEKTIGGSESDEGYSVQQTTDGGYIVAGYTKSYGAGNWDAYLIKVACDCVSQPQGDVTGDCKVDLRDFASMGEGWLDCGLDPSIPCW